MAKLIYPKLSYAVRGALYDVYNELCYFDLSEKGWEDALLIVLRDRGLRAEQQVKYTLKYKDHKIGFFVVDILVNKILVLELKAVRRLKGIHEAQLIAYLKRTRLELGMLVNFGRRELKIKRIPNFVSQRTSIRTEVNALNFSDKLLYPELTRKLRGILYEVHTELGPGFMHTQYLRAIEMELNWIHIPHELKEEVMIRFRDQPIEKRNTELLIVDKKVLIAPVAVRKITRDIVTCFRQYLKLLDLKLGLIANFHKQSLEINTVRV